METLELVSSDMFRYKKRCFPLNEKMRPKDLEQLLNFEIRPTNILLVTYPKSGQLLMTMDRNPIDQRSDVSTQSRPP